MHMIQSQTAIQKHPFQDLVNLKQGGRYTLIGFSDFGFPYAIKMRLESITIEKYAQYPDTAKLVFTPKGKRKLRGRRFTPGQEYIVWEGWHNPVADMFPEKKIATEAATSLLGFSGEYMVRALASVNVAPVAKNLKENPNA